MKFLAFSEEVSRSTLESLMSRLLQTLGRRVVVIDSPGGYFESLPRPEEPLIWAEYTSVAREVGSAAIVPYLLGKRRYALPEATFFFHQAQAEVDSLTTVPLAELEHALAVEREAARSRGEAPQGRVALEKLVCDAYAGQEWMISFMARHTRRDRSIFYNLMRAEATLSAREAMQYGLVEKIIHWEELIDA